MKDITLPEGTLMCGDCLELFKQIPDASVDLVFGSPPYEAVHRSYGIDFSLKGQEWVDWMVEVYKESLRVCRGLVAFVVGHGASGASTWTAAPALLMADLHRAGIILRNPAIYLRNGIPGSGMKQWLCADYEWIVCAANAPTLPWADVLANSTRKVRPRIGVVVSRRMRNGERDKHQFNATKAMSNPGNVIDCGNVPGKLGHIAREGEAPFPDKLPDFFIRSFCPPGGTVLDPFAGTGTTLGMAVRLRRKFIGMDIRESEIKKCLRRVKQARLRKGFGFGVPPEVQTAKAK